MRNEYEEKVLDIQMTATILFIISLLVSLSLTYNEKLKLKNMNTFYSNIEENKLAIGNRIFIVILSFVYLYIAYINIDIAKQKKEQLSPYSLQALASEITTVAAIIALYAVLISSNGVSEVENPSL